MSTVTPGKWPRANRQEGAWPRPNTALLTSCAHESLREVLKWRNRECWQRAHAGAAAMITATVAMPSNGPPLSPLLTSPHQPTAPQAQQARESCAPADKRACDSRKKTPPPRPAVHACSLDRGWWVTSVGRRGRRTLPQAAGLEGLQAREN